MAITLRTYGNYTDYNLLDIAYFVIEGLSPGDETIFLGYEDPTFAALTPSRDAGAVTTPWNLPADSSGVQVTKGFFLGEGVQANGPTQSFTFWMHSTSLCEISDRFGSPITVTFSGINLPVEYLVSGPTNLTATPMTGKIRLDWDDAVPVDTVCDVLYYPLKTETPPYFGSPDSLLSPNNFYDDGDRFHQLGHTYYYKITTWLYWNGRALTYPLNLNQGMYFYDHKIRDMYIRLPVNYKVSNIATAQPITENTVPTGPGAPGTPTFPTGPFTTLGETITLPAAPSTVQPHLVVCSGLIPGYAYSFYIFNEKAVTVILYDDKHFPFAVTRTENQGTFIGAPHDEVADSHGNIIFNYNLGNINRDLGTNGLVGMFEGHFSQQPIVVFFPDGREIPDFVQTDQVARQLKGSHYLIQDAASPPVDYIVGPVTLSANSTSHGVDLSWNAAEIIDSRQRPVYQIFRSIAVDTGFISPTYLGKTRNLSFTDTTSALGVTNNYRILVGFDIDLQEIPYPQYTTGSDTVVTHKTFRSNAVTGSKLKNAYSMDGLFIPLGS